jgi:hypothetical protein
MIVDKPWGKVVTFALNQPSSVRMITVEPGQETSEHYHQLRDEMWIVLDPGMEIQIGNRTIETQPGEESRSRTGSGTPARPAAESSRSLTATPRRTTRSASRTTTEGLWNRIGSALFDVRGGPVEG